MRWLKRPGGVPPPPAAGLTKLADPRRMVSGWLAFLIFCSVLIFGGWRYGLGRQLERMRREFVAAGYLRQAAEAARQRPVDRAKALAALRRAMALARHQAAFVRQAGMLAIELRAYREAAQWLWWGLERGGHRAEAEDPEGWLLQISFAQSALLTGRIGEGARILRAIKVRIAAARRERKLPDPVYALLLNNIGYVQCLTGLRLEEAQRLIETAVALEPTQPAYIDSLGWVTYLRGDYLTAAFQLERAVRLLLPEENAEMYYHLGAAYARLGKRADAIWALRRCLEIDPSFTEAQEELRVMQQELPPPLLAQRVSS